MSTISLNYYDYKVLVEQTVINYYSNLGKYIPNGFGRLEKIFFMELLQHYPVGQSTHLADINGKLILNIDNVIENIKGYKVVHNRSYNGRPIYKMSLRFSDISKTYIKLADIFRFGYEKDMAYKTGLRGIKNFIEIWDQTYMRGSDEEDGRNTSVLFLLDPKGTTNMDEYTVPVVLYDNRLGNFLGIPLKYWRQVRNFVLDCRSNMFLEIMKRWDMILVNISDCPEEKMYARCSRLYTRTKEYMPIWGKCKEFNSKVQTLAPETILFKNVPSWLAENQNYKINTES